MSWGSRKIISRLKGVNMKFLGFITFILLLSYSSYPTKTKRLEKELKILKRNIKGGNCNRQVFLEKFWTITFHNFFPVILAF